MNRRGFIGTLFGGAAGLLGTEARPTEHPANVWEARRGHYFDDLYCGDQLIVVMPPGDPIYQELVRLVGAKEASKRTG